MNNNYTINDILPKQRKHKEWTPAPGVGLLLSPLFRGICGASRITKWLQICQIALVFFTIFLFLFPGSKQTFPIVFSSVMGAVHLLLLIVGTSCCKKADAALTHYTSYLCIGAELPEGELARQIEIADLKDEAGQCVWSSIFGIIVSLLFALSACIINDGFGSFGSFQTIANTVLFGFTLPAFGVWAWVHYQQTGVLTFLGLLACGIADYWLGFPVTAILLLAIGVYLIATSRAVTALRFFAVYVSVVMLFLGMVALFLSTPRGVNMSVFACILAACLLPTVLQLVLRVCFRDSTVEVMEEGAEQPVLYLKRVRIMDFLYTYVWGGLGMLVCLAGLIVNFCSDKYSLLNYTKSQLELEPITIREEPQPIELNPDLSAYSRFGNSYSRSYGSSSDSSYSRRSKRYDDEAPRSSYRSYPTPDYDSDRNEYDYSYRGGSASSGLRFW